MTQIPTEQVNRWLLALSSGLTARYGEQLHDHLMIGICTGGVKVAEYLHQKLGFETPLGQLNIAFYRDDFSRIGLHPVVGASDLPFDVESRPILLVDDVLNSGRTIRAAMNEIFDFGRPASIALAVLIEREGRELPIHADVAGHTLALQPGQQIKLNPDTMDCLIKDTGVSDQ